MTGRLQTVVAAIGLIGLMASSAAAQTVNLIAAPFDKTVTLPNGSSATVPMWGFAIDEGTLGVLDGEVPTVPGPRITVPPGSTSLTVSLTNLLSAACTADSPKVSLVVLGQQYEASPAVVGGRVVSLTHETACGATQLYTFGTVDRPLKPGTFLYESGSHQAVQVQMGLYGAMTMDAIAGQAYTGVTYANEALLLYSEIDLALHQAVAAGDYGVEGVGPTSTIDYQPSLYLINGESYTGGAPVAAGVAGETTLVRLLNAGLKTHAPLLDNGLLTIVAEDGNPYPSSRTQAAVLLAAGKTHDAIWAPAAAGEYALYDRMLALNAAGQPEGGMLARLRVAGAGGDAVTAGDDGPYSTDEDTSIIAAASVLGNDSTTGTNPLSAELVAGTRAGTVTLYADGTFTYVPAANFSGFDSFTYVATDGTNTSLPATVTITVNPVNDAPMALAQEVGLDALTSAHISLAGSDPDGDALTFSVTALPAHGALSYIDPVTSIETTIAAPMPIPSALVIYTPDPVAPFAGVDTVQFAVSDGILASAADATVTATVHPLETDPGCGMACVALNVTVQDSTGVGVPAYRWTLEEDRTYLVDPNLSDPHTLSVSFHASYMPVAQTGDESTPIMADPNKRYFLSVLPTGGGYSIGGAPVAIGQTNVVVVVTHNNPIPTARIRVRVFHDNAPLNGVWDSAELGLEGFVVTVEDAGGRYGMSAGDQMTDAFGNMIGTTYAPCPAGETCTSYAVLTQGEGYVLTDADGWAVVPNLVPGKYGVKVRAPAGSIWQQTSTIEGTRVIDAWVKANEPNYFTEFGPPGPHAEVGFVQEYADPAQLTGANSISGQVKNLHMSRPPDFTFYPGAPFDFTQPWVALNTGAAGGQLIYAMPTDAEGNFTIEGVPDGSYQLWVFDSALNIVIASRVLNVTGSMALGDVSVFQWFTRNYNFVFEDLNEDGKWDADEAGLPEQAVNIRWRDGTMNQSAPTDGDGFVPFEQIFPFFAWQVAEVDYARLKATGVTIVVDNGGNPSVNTDWPATVGADLASNLLAPQPQAENGGAVYRTETGPVLVEAFQGFIGQSNVFLWGKAPYAPTGSVVTDVNVAPFDEFPTGDDVDENGNGVFDVDQYHGGVSGVVHYSTTRAENDPRWGFGEPWEPGVPRVRVQLWDKTRSHLLNEVTTDSWDDSLPTGCQARSYPADPAVDPFVFLDVATDCYDGMRVWNQVRPGVFDGGFAFYTMFQDSAASATFNEPLENRLAEVPLPAGDYVVKVIPPTGYQIVKEEDKNVDFGDEYIPQQFWLTGYTLGDAGYTDAPGQPTAVNMNVATPFCVGTLHDVPTDLALFPGVGGAYGDEQRPLCDAKLVRVRDGANAAANFFLFTEAPVAGHIIGFVLDDTQNEFDPNSPQFGEKYAPPFMPVSIHDWTGLEITRTLTDAYGRYNVLLPSTYTANAPQPSGMSPNMLTACINSALMPDPMNPGQFIPDPHHYRNYSNWCYTLQYMPGTTTYLDTPVVPTAAFAGSETFPVDAELPDQTPVIAQVTNLNLPGAAGTEIGPYIVDNDAANAAGDALRTIRITSAGLVNVPNPYYSGPGGTPKLVERDYGFGPASTNGVVRLDGQPITITSWTNLQIDAVVPRRMETGQLTVERCLTGAKALTATACPAASRRSVLGVTLSVASVQMHTEKPPVVVPPGAVIQPYITAAEAGDLILVPPGTYNEMVVMDKPVRLQGWGATSTTIHAVQVPAEKVAAWRTLVGTLLMENPGYLLPEQVDIGVPVPPFDQGDIAAALGGEHPGVLVLAQDLPTQTRPAGNSGNLVNTYRCLGTFAAPTNEAYCLHNENETWPDPRVDIVDVSRGDVDSGGLGSRLVTVTTAQPHEFSTGNLVEIAGVNPAPYAGDKTVDVLNETVFTYTVPNATADLNPPTVDATAQRVFRISTIAKAGSVVTVTTQDAHGFATGDHVTIGGVSPGGYNGEKIVIVTNATQFTYTQGGPPPTISLLGTARLTPPTPQWRPNARIDGLTISGSSNEAGVFANAYAHYLQISNNRVFNNLGNFGGGVRIGHSEAGAPALITADAQNVRVTIHHNVITQNAGLAGGGGVVLGTGSDNYTVSDNFIAGNFSSGWGAGITHYGLSPGGVIDRNVVTFNETFNQGLPRSGGGIFVGGPPAPLGGLTLGSGSVWVSNNLVQGNQAGAGDGGGIALVGVNGQDVMGNPLRRHTVSLYNNIVVNNTAGLAGAGISLQDAILVDIVHNTIARNDSFATAGAAFATFPTESDPQPAGIVSRGHTPLLAAALGGSGFSNPTLYNSIVWQNRSFYFGAVEGGVVVPGGGTVGYGLLVPANPYWDLGVLGAAGSLDPRSSVLTDTTGYDASNTNVAPLFVATYYNDQRNPAFAGNEATIGQGILVPPAFDEGGNFIRPQFGPLTRYRADGTIIGDYHLTNGVVGENLNLLYGDVSLVPPTLLFDFDAQLRDLVNPHRGADQVVSPLGVGAGPAGYDDAALVAGGFVVDTAAFGRALRAVELPADEGSSR